MAPHPEFDGFLVVLVLQDMMPFPLKRNGRQLECPATSRGAFGIHDLRNIYSAPKRPLFTLNLVMSRDYLDEVKSASISGRDLVSDHVEYTECDETLYHLGSALAPAFQNPGINDRFFVDHAVLAMSSYLLNRYGRQAASPSRLGPMSHKQERTAKDYLISNLESDVALADVAEACGLSAAYFARSFKQTTGVSPYRWLTFRRIELSKSLLELTDKPLAEVAVSCGFSDQSHFTRTFSRVIGVSPGAWRRGKSPRPLSESEHR
ncbi:helix-turn-helix domain-containing protein (plasmid) [Mesorhizobium sp. ORM8.1]